MDLRNMKRAGELVIELSRVGVKFNWKECIRITRELEQVFEALQIDAETNGQPANLIKCVNCHVPMVGVGGINDAAGWFYVESVGYHCPQCSENQGL
jgi:hypothetical protein